MKRLTALLLCLAMLFSLCACSDDEEKKTEESEEKYEAVSFENHGKTVTVKEMPQKVVTAGPNCTELFCALGLSDLVIGKCMSNHSTGALEEYADDYYTVPDIAEGYPTLEQLTASGCDFICATDWIFGENLTVKSLERAGITVFVLNSGSIGEMYRDVRDIAKIFGVSEAAEELISKDAARISAVNEELPEEAARVLVLDSFLGSKAYVAGAYSYENSLIAAAGGVNVFAELEKAWDAVTVEDIIAADPDFIIIHDYKSSGYDEKLDALLNNPELSQLDCLSDGQPRVMRLPLENCFPGVRCSLTVEAIAASLYADVSGAE